jgi:L-cystine transport system permease protein
MKTFRFDKIPELFVQIIQALPVTAEYVVLSLVIGVIFGSLLALAKLGKNRILKNLAYGYTTIMRCVPSVVLLFVVYYGLPRVINLDTTGKIKFVVITLSLFTAGSMSETFRSAYQSIDRVQTEAAKSIGMTGAQTFFHILLPQMLRISIPNISNSILALVKEGALAYTIGLYDLLGRGNYILGKHMGAFVIETYVTLIIIYWPISSLITLLGSGLEKKLNFGSGPKKEAENA